jgi:anti-sigma factor (TIGR02949 family)
MTHPDRLTCEETFLRLDDYLDRELSDEEMRIVRAHLETCAVCAHEYDFEHQVLERVRQKLARIKMPETLVIKIAKLLEAERHS